MKMRKRLVALAASAAMIGVGMLGLAPAAHAEEDGCHWGVTLVGGPHNDTLVGTNCDDSIWGLNGNDHIRGLYGDDFLNGGRGNDTITAKGSEGVIRGGRGFDVCVFPSSASNFAVYSCESVVLT